MYTIAASQTTHSVLSQARFSTRLSQALFTHGAVHIEDILQLATGAGDGGTRAAVVPKAACAALPVNKFARCFLVNGRVARGVCLSPPPVAQLAGTRCAHEYGKAVIRIWKLARYSALVSSNAPILSSACALQVLTLTTQRKLPDRRLFYTLRDHKKQSLVLHLVKT